MVLDLTNISFKQFDNEHLKVAFCYDREQRGTGIAISVMIGASVLLTDVLKVTTVC